MTFTDLDPAKHDIRAIEWMKEKGITAGIGDGKYGPDLPVTRAQMAAFLFRALEDPLSPKPPAPVTMGQLIQAEMLKRGAPPMNYDFIMEKACLRRAARLAIAKDLFHEDDPILVNPCAEIISWNYRQSTDALTAARISEQFYNSEAHWNIVKDPQRHYVAYAVVDGFTSPENYNKPCIYAVGLLSRSAGVEDLTKSY